MCLPDLFEKVHSFNICPLLTYASQKSYWCGPGAVKSSKTLIDEDLDSNSSSSHDYDGINEVSYLLANSRSPRSTKTSGEFFETGPQGLQVGISIRNLRKVIVFCHRLCTFDSVRTTMDQKHLVSTKYLPILLYGTEACCLSTSGIRSLDFVVMRFFMKLFRTNNANLILEILSF
jgi:hypothetical protein